MDVCIVLASAMGILGFVLYSAYLSRPRDQQGWHNEDHSTEEVGVAVGRRRSRRRREAACDTVHMLRPRGVSFGFTCSVFRLSFPFFLCMKRFILVFRFGMAPFNHSINIPVTVTISISRSPRVQWINHGERL